MSNIPPDFGGFLGYWHEGTAYLVRYGRGEPIEGVAMSPLNVLQAHKLLGDLAETGEQDGHITHEHFLQSAQLPTSHGIDKVMGRAQVDAVAPEPVEHREQSLILAPLGLTFTPTDHGLIVEGDGVNVTLGERQVDALIRVAGEAWEAMGL